MPRIEPATSQLDELGTSMQSTSALKDMQREEIMERALDMTDSLFADVLHQWALEQPEDDPHSPWLLNFIGQLFWTRFAEENDIIDLERAISSFDTSVRLTPDFDPEQAMRLDQLGVALISRSRRTRDVSDIDRACFCFESCLLVQPPGEDVIPTLSNLGSSLIARFNCFGDMDDINRAVTVLQQVIDTSPDDDVNKSAYWHNLRNALEARFDCIEDTSDLKANLHFADAMFEWAFKRVDDDPYKPWLSSLLGDFFFNRFQVGYHRTDLDRAISSFDDAVRLTKDIDQEQVHRLDRLGVVLYARFGKTMDMSDINKACFCFEQALLVEPTGPHAGGLMRNLGAALQERATHLPGVDDIDRAITVLEQAVEISSEDDFNKPECLNNLGNALQTRFDRLGTVSDIEKSITVLRAAVNLLPDEHPSKSSCLTNLGNGLESRFGRFGGLTDIEESVAVKEKAVGVTADGDFNKPSRISNLGSALFTRYIHLRIISDLEASIVAQRKAIDMTPDGDPDHARYHANLASALHMRFKCFADVSDLDVSISISQKVLDSTPDGHPDRLGYLILSPRTGVLQRSITTLRRVLELNSDGHPRKPDLLSDLGEALDLLFDHSGDISDLEEAITVKQAAVNQTPAENPYKPTYLRELSVSLHTKANENGDASGLDEVVTLLRGALDLTVIGSPRKAGLLATLGLVLESRFLHLGDILDINASISSLRNAVELTPGGISDLHAAIEAFSAAAESATAFPHIRLFSTRGWCISCQMAEDPAQILKAYGYAVSLIPQVAWLGMGVESRHSELLWGIGDLIKPAAAAAFRYGEYDLALEWLEQGRSVVWGQTLQLRSPLDQLRERDPIRADRLTAISRAMERIAQGKGSSTDERGPERRALASEWGKILSEIRHLEGLDDFLGRKKIHQLLPAASQGPVVVLNTHEDGCHALVLSAEAQGVVHFSLDFTSDRAQVLLDTLRSVEVRQPSSTNVGPIGRGFRFPARDGPSVNEEIKVLLAELWRCVVKPVLDGLAFSLRTNKDEDLRRIWWCPTGPLAFLPIHAAGLYDTDETGTKVFDFVVSSYTPTVSALLQAPPSPIRLQHPRILAVAQPAAQGQSPLPNTEREVSLLRDRAIANAVNVVVATDESATIKHVLDEMDKCNWVHLACHGTQNLDHPTKNPFILADGDLELMEIIKKPLPHAEFAFLSACQTATGDPQLTLTEEAVYLAAGFLLAGYRSVIATMWAIFDKDGPIVADAVYAEMLKGGKGDASRAAYALHSAVQRLRLSGAPFLAWMPFIHMGS